jgi:uncharacterized protein (TIGR02145 family)
MLLRVKSLINKIMKHFFTISLCFLALSLRAQENCIGPDFNSDGEIGSADLIVFLSYYGNDWPESNEFVCGETIPHQDYAYQTVQIGDQCWFSENCRYLPEVSPSSQGSDTTPYYYVYDYDGTDVATAQFQSAYYTYGVLYNWSAVMTEGICPSGWHIPTDLEWQTMEMALGMSTSDAESIGWRGSPVGGYMKSATNWNGTDSSGYNGLPAGFISTNGFSWAGTVAYWWSSSDSGSSAAWVRRLYSDTDNVSRFYYDRNHGFSARCIKD